MAFGETIVPKAKRVSIYDTAGRSLVEAYCPEGQRFLDLDLSDTGGRTLPAGIYFARVTAAGCHAVLKIVVVQ
jgi:hypothetical protein